VCEGLEMRIGYEMHSRDITILSSKIP
jgi:hypothetical protein